MNQPRATTRCRRCDNAYGAHGDARRCPDGSGRSWLGKVHSGASQSFSEDEIIWLDDVFKTLMRHGDTRSLARKSEIGTVARKVAVMKARITSQRKPS